MNHCCVCYKFFEYSHYGVFCEGCNLCFCGYCPKSNDAVSSLALIFSRFIDKTDDNNNERLTYDELDKFFKDINSNEFLTYINNRSDLQDNKKNRVFILIKELNESKEEEDINNIENFIKDFIEELNNRIIIRLPFTCNMCFQGIDVQY